MPLPQEPHYDALLPDDWLSTAWEPPTALLRQAYRHLQDEADAGEGIAATLAQNPAASDAYNACGIQHARLRQWPEAKIAFDAAIMLSNQYHHYVHYICSAIHAARAEWTTDPLKRAEAIAAALFQDPANRRVLALKAGEPLPDYARPMWEDAQWPRAIRPPTGRIELEVHNSGVWLCRDGAPVRAAAQSAFALHDAGRGADAQATMEDAARLAHRWHRHYHRQASIHRLHRGRAWEALDEPLLALDELRHAHDIDPGFALPLYRRAALQRILGHAAAAEADEAKAAKL